jgi:hypothetical protein
MGKAGLQGCCTARFFLFFAPMKITEKRSILKLLRQKDLATILDFLATIPAIQTINPLFSGICHADERVRWHAIAAMGPSLARLADQDMEGARVVMRRFMWSLNDESGGIGWGAPEAMAEAMVQHSRLAEEYCHILVAFMREDGFFLEHPPLQRGLMWAIARLAEHRRELLLEKEADTYLLPYLLEKDEEVKTLAAYALATLSSEKACRQLHVIQDLPPSVAVYSPEKDKQVTIDLEVLIKQRCTPQP